MTGNEFAAHLKTLSDDDLRATSLACYRAHRRMARADELYEQCLCCEAEWENRGQVAVWDGVVHQVRWEIREAARQNRERMG